MPNPLIRDFDRRSGDYGARTPYVRDFVHRCLMEQAIGAQDHALDLCTGRGEIASIVAERTKLVDAVDASQGMLLLADQKENIFYKLLDVNGDEFDSVYRGRSWKVVTIGRGVHFVGAQRLAKLRDNLLPEAKLIIFNSGLNDRNPWIVEYYSLLLDHGIIRGIHKGKGKENLDGAGYREPRLYRQNFRTSVPVEYLSRLALSYPGSDGAAKDFDSFVAETRRRLAHYAQSGSIELAFYNAAMVFDA